MIRYDETRCQLGEGPLWHPLRQQLFWFDILAKTLFSKKDGKLLQWHFKEFVSAAGWVDQDHLVIASESALFTFNLVTGVQTHLCDLEADNAVTRSNDGRADPWGGFWIGTMGKQAEAEAGAIYRYYNAELRQLTADITISNAICFSPDRQFGYYADTAEQKIWRTPLSQSDGWPNGDSQLFIDFSQDNLNPDGAICDSAGNLWIAQWGASCVAQYSESGRFLKSIAVPATQVTCPALGGKDFNQLFITSAQQGLTAAERAQQDAGMTFSVISDTRGLPEPQVKI